MIYCVGLEFWDLLGLFETTNVGFSNGILAFGLVMNTHILTTAKEDIMELNIWYRFGPVHINKNI